MEVALRVCPLSYAIDGAQVNGFDFQLATAQNRLAEGFFQKLFATRLGERPEG